MLIYLYRIIRLLSLFVRNFCLPNPFENLRNHTINFNGYDIPIIPELLNFMFEGVMYSITYAVVDIYYNKNEKNSAKGSLLYLVFYIYHTTLLGVLSKLNFSPSSIAATVILFFGIHLLIFLIRNTLYNIKMFNY